MASGEEDIRKDAAAVVILLKIMKWRRRWWRKRWSLYSFLSIYPVYQNQWPEKAQEVKILCNINTACCPNNEHNSLAVSHLKGVNALGTKKRWDTHWYRHCQSLANITLKLLSQNIYTLKDILTDTDWEDFLIFLWAVILLLIFFM